MQRIYRLLNRVVLGGGILGVCSNYCLAAAAHAPSTCTYHYTQRPFHINGHSVPVEYYIPDGHGPFPLVFMLHGSAGAFSLKSANEPPLDNFGEKTLARSCFAVVFPHYLEALGDKSITSEQEMILLFPQMLAATGLLLTRAETLTAVKGQPVFLFGESLGGYLSIALSFQRSEIVAVSEFSAGLPQGYPLNRAHGPSILISHGTDDNLVPVLQAEELKTFCINHDLPVTINLYPNAGHYLSPSIKNKIISDTVNFFRSRSHEAG